MRKKQKNKKYININGRKFDRFIEKNKYYC